MEFIALTLTENKNSKPVDNNENIDKNQPKFSLIARLQFQDKNNK